MLSIPVQLCVFLAVALFCYLAFLLWREWMEGDDNTNYYGDS